MQIFDKKTIEYLMKLFKGVIFTPDGNLDVEHEGADPSHVRVKNDVGQLDLLVDEIGDRGLYDTTEYETGWLIKTDGLDTYMNKGDVKAANSIEAGVHISAVGDITAGRDASVGQDLTVTRDISAGRNITATGNVGADQDVAVGRNVSATGNVSAGLDVSATRNISATGNNSAITSGGTITAAGDISSSGGDITAYGDVTAGGDVKATGDLLGVNISATGNIEADGNVSVDGTITAGGNITGAGFVVPGVTSPSTKFLLADGGVDSYGRGWYMKRGSAYTSNLQSASASCWLKVASTTINGTITNDAAVTFFVGEYYLRHGSGILKVSCRKDSGASVISSVKTKAVWICRDRDVIPENYVVTGKVVSSTQTIFNVYCKLSGQYKVQRFSMLDEGGWNAKANLWTLYNSKPPVDNIYCFSDIPSDETAIPSVDESYAATAGAVASPSDERLKDVKSNVKLAIEDIANAPSVLFKWKDREDDKTYLGSIAQYWQNIAPWVVSEDNDGMLSLNYPVLALAAGIQCAREVVDLSKEVAELKEQIAELRKLVNG